ncbi:MAG: succinate dehydrogenase cytochrome b subunit [Alphaproteobacteria bacterium]|nr:succinate dehydrogenase cytochrome b subunit [Alphaproteobacteria bacterium]
MSWLLRFTKSTIGLKVIMALSGLALFGFVIGHMLGNLQIYLGETTLDHYGESLKSNAGLLWIIRATLLGILTAHVVSSVKLVLRSKAARPQGYKQWKSKVSTYASRTMKMSGPIVLAFLVYHLLHFTVGFDSLGLGDTAVSTTIEHCSHVAAGELDCPVYANVIKGFSAPAIVAFYIFAQLLLGMHLGHGAYSMFRTLGLNNPRYDRLARAFATGVAVVIVVGNCSIPLAVLTGVVGG